MKQIIITTRTGMKVYSNPMSEIEAGDFMLNLSCLSNQAFFSMPNVLIHKEAVDSVVIIPYTKKGHLTLVRD